MEYKTRIWENLLERISKEHLKQIKKDCEDDILRIQNNSADACDKLSLIIELINQSLAK